MAEGWKAEMNDSFTLRLEDAPTELQLKDLYKYVLDEKNGGNGCKVAIDVLLHIEDKSVADKLVGVEHTISDKKVTLNHFESRRDEDMDMSGKIVVSGVKGIDLHCILLHFSSRDYSGDGSTPQYERVSDDEVILQFKDPKFASHVVRKNHEILNFENEEKQPVEAKLFEVFEVVIAFKNPGLKCEIDPAQFGVRIRGNKIQGSFEQIQAVRRYLTSDNVNSPSTEDECTGMEEESEGEQVLGHKLQKPSVLRTVSNNVKSGSSSSPKDRVNKHPSQQLQQPQQQGQQQQSQQHQQQQTETKKAENEMLQLDPRVVLYITRQHGSDGKFGDVKLKWTDENEHVTVSSETKYLSDFMKLYNLYKPIILSATLVVNTVCKHKVKRIVDRYHSKHKDLSILLQGAHLVFIGTQDVIDRDLALAENELMGGDCSPTCPCKNHDSPSVGSSTPAAHSSPPSSSQLFESASNQRSTGGASVSSGAVRTLNKVYTLPLTYVNLKLVVHQQNLLNTKVDALLCFTDESLQGGTVMESLLKFDVGLKVAIDKATNQNFFKKNYEKDIVALPLKGFQRYVVCMVATSIHTEKMLGDYVERLLKYADGLKIGSLALPLLGTGSALKGCRLSEEDATRDIFNAIISSKLNNLREIHLVSTNDGTIKKIIGALDSASSQHPRGH